MRLSQPVSIEKPLRDWRPQMVPIDCQRKSLAFQQAYNPLKTRGYVAKDASLGGHEGRIGWGTWIRTKINGVRVRRSTVELFPSRKSLVAHRCAALITKHLALANTLCEKNRHHFWSCLPRPKKPLANAPEAVIFRSTKRSDASCMLQSVARRDGLIK